MDSHGLHFSLKDSASLNLEADGKVLINGAMGITGIKKASTFTIGIVLVIITLLVILNLVNSRAGRAIKAIRDNEIAARSVGIPITKYKLMAFVTSAVFAGVAGVLYALNYSSLVAKKFDYNTSILILVFVVLGGIGNLRGSVIAAAVLTVLPELLRSMNDYRSSSRALFPCKQADGAARAGVDNASARRMPRARVPKTKKKRGWRKWHCWRSVTWVLRSAACRPLRSSIFPLKRVICTV